MPKRSLPLRNPPLQSTAHFPALHLPSATVSNSIGLPLPLSLLLFTTVTPPRSSHGTRFLHWLTSKCSSRRQPSETASTPTPVTRTHPRTESRRSSSRCSEMDRRDESDTAEPQKARLRCVSEGQPSARTSVAVSERAQQKDWD